MDVEFRHYDPEKTEVYVTQMTISSSTTHIAIENEDREETLRIFMSEDNIQAFIDKLQKSLDERKEERKRSEQEWST